MLLPTETVYLMSGGAEFYSVYMCLTSTRRRVCRGSWPVGAGSRFSSHNLLPTSPEEPRGKEIAWNEQQQQHTLGHFLLDIPEI